MNACGHQPARATFVFVACCAVSSVLTSGSSIAHVANDPTCFRGGVSAPLPAIADTSGFASVSTDHGPAPDYLTRRAYAAGGSLSPAIRTAQLSPPNYGWRRSITNAAYVAGYGAGAYIGTPYAMRADYKVIRLESAYAYDVIGHVYCANQLGLILTSLNRWAGYSEKDSRRRGAWWGAFGIMSFMELINGFVPTVRLDPLDIPSNALGAWLADGYLDIVERHPHLEHFSLQFGFKSVARVVSDTHSSNIAVNAWHDYANGRFGLGYHVGSVRRPWITLFATYSISSMNITQLRNRFGFGVELPVVAWTSPLIRHVPGGDTFVTVYSWLDDRWLMPLFYIQLYEHDTPAWSDRAPFRE